MLASNSVKSQEITSLWKQTKERAKHPIKMSGTISANQIYYNAWGGDLRLQPYSYFLIGRLNFDVMGIKLPFTFKFSNQKYSIKKPQFQSFNNFGVAPTYKWVKLYLGYNSVQFSNYILSSPFTGIGVKLTPNKFEITALYGRFSKAIEFDTINNTQPMYKRNGYAFKVKYRDGSDFIGLSMFKAVDDSNSLENKYYNGNFMKPQENFVYSIEAGKKFLTNFVFSTEFANSFITDNITNLELTNYKKSFSNFGYNFINPKVSTGSYLAYRGRLVYTLKSYNVGVNFEHIDAGYATLGVPYFNSDLERISLLFASQLMKDKIRFTFNIGREKNNLNDEKVTSSKRFNYSINANFLPSKRVNISMNYSNFTSISRMQSNFETINISEFEFIDTLNYSQVAQNANLNGFFMLSDPKNIEKQQNLLLNLSFQQASDVRNNNTDENITQNTNINISYIHSLLPKSLSFTATVNGNYSKFTGFDNYTYGPTLGITKSFFKRKWSNALSVSYNQTISNSIKQNEFVNFRFSSNYRLKKKHNFRLSIITINRKNLTNESFTELTGTFIYTYRF